MQRDCLNNGAFDTTLGHTPHGKRAAAENRPLLALLEQLKNSCRDRLLA